MTKDFCGICKKSVKYSAILCTGSCNKWLHFRCAELSTSDIRSMEKTDFLGKWKCIKCQVNSSKNEIDAGINENDNSDKMNFSSLAEELNKSILHENEELRQELHREKNRSSLFTLELEDKLKEMEEKNEVNRKTYIEKEEELLSKIKFLEERLKKEKEARESFVLQVEEDADKCTEQNRDQHKTCRRCVIFEEEMKKMLETIRTLESVISILQKDNTESKKSVEKNVITSSCLKCFPPLDISNNKQQNLTTPDFVQTVPPTSYKLQISNTVKKPVSNKFQDIKIGQKMLICADSHGRDLAAQVNNYSKSLDAVGFVRPGGLAEDILNFNNIDGENLGPEDILVVMCGSNDVACNEAERALKSIEGTLKNYYGRKIILVDFPIRYDLSSWSCLNKEIIRSNTEIDALCNSYPNVLLVKSSMAGRNLHTRHGMHLNRLGKLWLARRICEVLKDNTVPVSSPVRRSSRGCSPESTSTPQSTPRDGSHQLHERPSSALATPATESSSSCKSPAVTVAQEMIFPGNLSPPHLTTPP